jgi:hypothetical protein
MEDKVEPEYVSMACTGIEDRNHRTSTSVIQYVRQYEPLLRSVRIQHRSIVCPAITFPKALNPLPKLPK